ncbi:MAG: hypothetical protein KGZ97_03120 [Bacteroidetes bacterium]|nr:hypothetical protein [Bacteroidota bacterium]
MKKVIKIFGALLIATAFMTSCGTSQPENKYLGKIPGVVQKHNKERERILEAQNKAKSPEEYAKLKKQLSEHDKELNNWMTGYGSSGEIKPNIPFEVAGEFPYIVDEVGFIINGSVVEVTFLLTTKENFKVQIPRQKITLYFIGLDSNNSPIVLSAMVAGMYDIREALPAGSKITLKGIWNKDHLSFLQDLASIRIISQNQYKEFNKGKR